ncbi:MAG: MobC family plasmid mobilization relaxosome protein [Hyphomicrobiaceae bacterium]
MSRSEKRARTHLIGVRVTPDELAHASRLAVRDGLTVSGLFRSKVLDTPQPRQSLRNPRPGVAVADPKDLARVLGAIGRIGNNVNQLARVANAGSWPDAQTLAEACADIRDMRRALMQALGVPSPDDDGPPSPASGPRP